MTLYVLRCKLNILGGHPMINALDNRAQSQEETLVYSELSMCDKKYFGNKKLGTDDKVAHDPGMFNVHFCQTLVW
jgi:hypothetical protein